MVGIAHHQGRRAELFSSGHAREQRLDLDLVRRIAGMSQRAGPGEGSAVRSALRAAATTCMPAVPRKQRASASPNPGPTPTMTASSGEGMAGGYPPPRPPPQGGGRKGHDARIRVLDSEALGDP